jgi:hypothetical protein
MNLNVFITARRKRQKTINRFNLLFGVAQFRLSIFKPSAIVNNVTRLIILELIVHQPKQGYPCGNRKPFVMQ